ncbi:hypothetical protein P691DRAFT_62035 [Macrolepiota fuliginosa MF-IS2]|uniref:DUF7587 domain-containing protein n=1 Tax=Macrolepiota fuliginosa MF-IS2 TaxID=1400762 RepID=A0A9P5XMX8_9AGAR|nr:hypothetical protein P691DRAFT_62035 [Macrolepiota fuliginosa MF-IS2]
MSTHPPMPTSEGALPQSGFGAESNFESLLKDNPFLFRIYTPKERSPFFDDTDPYFLAPKFNERCVRSPVEIRDHTQLIDEWEVTYSDVAKHMDWTTRMASPFISTSFSFAWCIWDALRRFHQGVKKDVQVAIIDGRAVADRAMTAVELLNKSLPNQRNKEYWKWQRFSQESQSVLVYGSIPGTAVLASIPLLAILRHLPSYFLQPGYHGLNSDNPLIGIGWDYTERKTSYRRFCRDMASRFHGLNTEEKLADTTAGSLALALAFLRPWFHQAVDVDNRQAVQSLTDLAFIIAQWPGRWWINEHPETHELIHAMTLTLYEELREKHGLQVKDEVLRLQGVVDELHEVVREYEDKFSSLGKRFKANQSRKPIPTLFINPAAPVFSPPIHTPSPPQLRITPLPASKIQTPLTPPDTPKSSTFASFFPQTEVNVRPPVSAQDKAAGPALADEFESRSTSTPGTSPLLSAALITSINAIANQSLPIPKHDNPDEISPSHSRSPQLGPKPIALTPPLLQPQHSHTPSSALSELRPEEIPLPPTPPQCSSEVPPECLPLPPSPFDDDDSWTMILSHTSDFDREDGDDDTQVDEDGSYRKDLQDSLATLRDMNDSPPGSPTLVFGQLSAPAAPKEVPEYVPPRPRSGIFAEPLEFDYSLVEVDEDCMSRQPPGFIETAGCVVTGFLVGAFITIALFSPQRRMMIHLT